MLGRVLRELQDGRGTLRLEDLARRMEMEPSALKGLVDFWVRKGRLTLAADEAAQSAACTGACGSACPGEAQCVFVARMPAIYSVTPVKE
jgi:hypothetical protein